MPSRPESPAHALKVTDTRGPFVAGSIAVCRAAGVVALHFGTPSGRFVFHVREHSFVKHARGKVDYHGNPFRTLDQIEEEQAKQREAEARALAESTGQTAASPASPPASVIAPAPAQDDGNVPFVSASALASDRQRYDEAACARAWTLLTSDLALAVNVAAYLAGVSPSNLSRFIHAHHRGELVTLRRAAGMPLRARGASEDKA